ncbi:MAG: hypothetical protein ABSA47_15315 [Verrucomicrobiota bacterium]|jgi:hypothetical protein
MKALIRKEIRENLKAALVGFVIFSLLLIGAYLLSAKWLVYVLANRSVQEDLAQPLLSPALLAEAACFCAIFGVALGWLQARSEAHWDLWAFLIHRPLTRGQIFRGKTTAGMCLYGFGAGLPAAIFTAVVRWPGHVAAPFEWAMVLPLASIVLTGAAWYFAGMLAGLRQARWFGSRGLGVALALVASTGVFNFSECWRALVLIAIAVAILATSVWGGYQSGGYYGGQPACGKLALIVAMTAGCAGALLGAMGLLVNLVLLPLTQTSTESSEYQMSGDGTIYKETTRDGPEGVVEEVADLDGHPLLDPKTGRRIERAAYQKLFSVVRRTIFTDFKRRKNRNDFVDADRFFILLNAKDKTLWYLDHHGRLTGYDGRTRKRVGSLEPRGADGAPASEPFLEGSAYYGFYNQASQILLATAKTVYQVDFKARAVKPVFTTPSDDEIRGYNATVIASSKDDIPPTRCFILATRKFVRLFDSEFRPVFAAPYQPGPVEYPQVDALFLQPTNPATPNFALWFSPDPEMNERSDFKLPIHVVWLGPGESAARSADLPILRRAGVEPWPRTLGAALLPPLVVMASVKDIYSPWNMLSLALALVSAGIAWSLARRHNSSTSARVGWTLFVLLLGGTGLLALLCVQEWPARESCPNCKKLRAVDREFCEHCQSPFPTPDKNGTEIFAPLVKT